MQMLDLKIPANRELEEWVLGCLMIESSLLAEVTPILKREYFFFPETMFLYDTIQKMSAENLSYDIYSIVMFLKDEKNIPINNVHFYLADITGKIVSTANVYTNCLALGEYSIRRNMIHFAENTLRMAYNEDLDILDTLSKVNKETENLNSLIPQNERDIKEIVLEQILELASNKPKVNGLKTPIKFLDRVTNGWQPTDLIVLAARPAMGKTAFVLEQVNTALKNNNSVGFISLEMSAEQLVQRLLSQNSKVQLHKIKNKLHTEIEFKQIEQSATLISNGKLYVNDKPMTFTEIKSCAINWQKNYNIEVLIIDYLGLITESGKFGTREQFIAQTTRNLKMLAKFLQIPVILLSQLSRAVEQRSDKRPLLSDLKDSGAIEADADLVLFLHRPKYYEPTIEADDEIIIAKHRNGDTLTISSYFDGETTSWLDEKRESYKVMQPIVEKQYKPLKPKGEPPLMNGLDDDVPF